MTSQRLYGRTRCGSLTQDQNILMQSLLPKFSCENFLKETNGPKVMEIGFGGGEHLFHQAVQNPCCLFLGCEPFENGVAQLLQKIEAENVQNISILNGDARFLIADMKDKELDILYLLFPDPWPKKKHWKRRFFHQENLPTLHRLLKNNGEFRIATDHPSYQSWIEEILNSEIAQELFTWVNKDETLLPWKEYVQTRYHQKALLHDREIRYYILKKN